MNTYYKIAAALMLATGVQTTATFAQVKKTNMAAPAKKTTTQAPVRKVAVDSVSYALGMDVAKTFSTSGLPLNSQSFIQGMEAVLQNKATLFGEEEKMQIIRTAFTKASEVKAAGLKKEEQAFFETLKSNPKVKLLQDGLYYEVLTEGTGAKPTMEDEINVHYKGALANGKVFDSSYDRGRPIDLSLAQVIRGWQIGIPLMSVGSKYRLYIPSALGYGERGAGADIPPYSALVFDIELLGIKGQDATK